MSTAVSKQGRAQAASASRELGLSSIGRGMATPLSADSLVRPAHAAVATGVKHAGPGADVELVLA
jgi:hypothetical protein